jgi:CRP-like cAMP-binding protein
MGMVKLPRRLRQDAKLQLLADNPALAGCRPADLLALAAAADVVGCDRGDVLSFRDNPGRRWWLVLEGALEVLWDSSWPTSIEVGQAFGAAPGDRRDHLAFLADRATIVAAEPSVVLVASRGSLLALADQSPRLAEAITRASTDLVGQEFEELLRRTGDDRPITVDHDGPLDEDRVGGERLEQLVAARTTQAELGKPGFAGARHDERVISPEKDEDTLDIGTRRRIP